MREQPHQQVVVRGRGPGRVAPAPLDRARAAPASAARPRSRSRSGGCRGRRRPGCAPRTVARAGPPGLPRRPSRATIRAVPTVEVNGLELAFERAGEGPPLVLVHGVLCDSRAWRPQLAGLADELTVVAWDEPGAGRSPDPPEPFGLADYADSLAGLIEALGLGPAAVRRHVLGRDRRPGALPAPARAGRRPDPGRHATPAGRARCRPRSAPSASRRAWPVGHASRRRSPTQWLPSLFSEQAPAEVVDELGAILRDFRPAGFRGWSRPRPPPPTTATCCRGSRSRPCSSGASTTPARRSRSRSGCATRSRGARLAVIPDCGHVSNLEQPELFNAEAARLLPRARLLSSRAGAPEHPPRRPRHRARRRDRALRRAARRNAGDRRPRPPRPRAASGVHAPACWTLPSHASMFTGLLPRATGILDLPEGSPLAGARGARRPPRPLPPPRAARRTATRPAASAPTSGSRSTRASASASTSSATSAPGARPTSTAPGSATALRWAREALRREVRRRRRRGRSHAARLARQRRAASRGSGS